MKFYKDTFLRGMVAEWSDKYIDYKRLKTQIGVIKDQAIKLAEAYSSIIEITGEEINVNIDLKRVRDEETFWNMLDDTLQMVNGFYKEQISGMLIQFHALTKQTIKLGLISDYVPKQKSFSSRLDREVSRRKGLKHAKISFRIDRVNRYDEGEKEEEDFTASGSFPLKRLRSNSVSLFDAETTVPLTSLETETIVIQRHDKRMSPQQLRESFCEFYRGLVLLESYCELNYEGIRKMVKKFDKNFGTITQSHYMSSVVGPLDFHKHSTLKLLITETEHVFAVAFAEGRRTKAMDELRIPKHQKEVGLSLFRLGWHLGLSLPLFCLIIYNVIFVPKSVFPRYDSMFIVYRMMGMGILMVWCWGFDMWLWTKYRVNYVFIFEFNPRSHVRYQNMLEGASLFTTMWIFSIFLYVVSATKPHGFEWMNKIPYQVHPLFLIVMFLITFFVFQVRTKWWLARTLLNIVLSPFRPVVFRDFFLADQLASISIVLYDLEYSVCFFLSDTWSGNDACMRANTWTRPLIATLPALWRFLQCLRRHRDTPDRAHLLNAGKYATTFFVAIFSALRANVNQNWQTFWIIALICSTAYTNYWDVIRDWGLGNPEDNYLRRKLLYKYRAFYYWAIVSNFCLRLTWLLTISPEAIGMWMNPAVFSVILATLEILRRMQWNLLRMENEQINNVGRYRAVNVLVPPSDQESVKPSVAQKQRGIIVEHAHKAFEFFQKSFSGEYVNLKDKFTSIKKDTGSTSSSNSHSSYEMDRDIDNNQKSVHFCPLEKESSREHLIVHAHTDDDDSPGMSPIISSPAKEEDGAIPLSLAAAVAHESEIPVPPLAMIGTVPRSIEAEYEKHHHVPPPPFVKKLSSMYDSPLLRDATVKKIRSPKGEKEKEKGGFSIRASNTFNPRGSLPNSPQTSIPVTEDYPESNHWNNNQNIE